MAGDPQEEHSADGQTVSVDAALKLVEGEQNEAKVLGATLLLRHHNKLLLNVKGHTERSRLRVALGGATFLCRLLQSSVPLQRLALGLMAVLLAGTEEEAQQAALELLEVVPFLVACASKSEISESQAAFWGPEEFCETLGLLKRLLDLLPPTEAKSKLVEGCQEVLALLLPSQKCARFLAKEEVATSALGLTELLFARHDFLNGRRDENPDKDLSALLEAVVLEPCFRGSSCQTAALQLLAGRRPNMQRLDEVISCSLGSGATAQRALLQLAAGLLAAHGTWMQPNDKADGLSRLKTLNVLAAGELRMALEGYGSKEGLAAACMLLEEAIVALGKEAETLEAGNLEEVSECLQELHRALRDIFDYCADLPVTVTAPEELAMVARVVAAFQLEDPQRFSSEFQRSIETFCSLEAAEFKVLLPCLQELQDWHYTKAFAKVLEVAKWGLEHGSEPEGPEVWRQCSMMLAEVALDAAVYLPDVFIPEPDEETSDQAAVSGSSAPEFDLACSILSGVRLPRPVPAADANHQGAQRLCQWSQRLWRAGHGSVINGDPRHLWELTLLSASLLTSVPFETVQKGWPAGGADMWAALAGCVLSETEVEATTGRLAVRLAGFSLDRHQAWPQALVRVAHERKRYTVSKSIERLLENLSSDDEWEVADRAAFKALQAFLAASVKLLPLDAGYPTALEGMD